MSRADAIMVVMLRAPRRRRGWTADEIASELQITPREISIMLGQMSYWGWLERIGRRRYVVVDPVSAESRLRRRETPLPDGVQIVPGTGDTGAVWLSGARWICPECGAAKSVRLVARGRVMFASHGRCERREHALDQLQRHQAAMTNDPNESGAG